MKNKSDLTNFEKKILWNSEIDLSVGYPEFALPLWLNEIWDNYSNRQLIDNYISKNSQLQVIGGEHSPRSNILERELKKSVCRFLEIDESNVENTFILFSGSHALERAISSQLVNNCDVIVSNPIIDIIPAMVSQSNSKIIFADTEIHDMNELVSNVKKAITENTKCIILCSPSNPMGVCLSRDNIYELSEICIEKGIALIVDQCFSKINPFNNEIPLLPNLNLEKLKWICIWDTGKTYDLDDEKLGFIICNPIIRNSIEKNIDVLQCLLPKRALMMFKLIFDASIDNNYLQCFSKMIRDNLEFIINELTDTDIKLNVPKAGSLLLLDISNCGLLDIEFVDSLLTNRKIGVVPGYSFFHLPTPKMHHFIRIPLSRNIELLTKAVREIKDEYNCIKNRRTMHSTPTAAKA